MRSVVDRLAAAGLSLPSPPVPAGSYVPAVRAGDLVFTAGQLPFSDGALIARGPVGSAVTAEQASECAAICALNALAAASTVCDLDEVVQAVKLVCYVASDSSFSAQPSVADGASRVLSEAFGDCGRHAREAVGVAVLPLDSPVEVSLVLQVG